MIQQDASLFAVSAWKTYIHIIYIYYYIYYIYISCVRYFARIGHASALSSGSSLERRMKFVQGGLLCRLWCKWGGTRTNLEVCSFSRLGALRFWRRAGFRPVYLPGARAWSAALVTFSRQCSRPGARLGSNQQLHTNGHG